MFASHSGESAHCETSGRGSFDGRLIRFVQDCFQSMELQSGHLRSLNLRQTLYQERPCSSARYLDLMRHWMARGYAPRGSSSPWSGSMDGC